MQGVIHSNRGLWALLPAVLLVLAILLAAGAVRAQNGAPDQRAVISSVADEVAKIEARLANDTLDSTTSNEFRLKLEDRRLALLDIAEDAKTRLAPLREQQAALGDPPEGDATEPPEIAARRAELTEAITDLEALRKSAVQSAAQARDLFDRLTAAERERFRAALIERTPSPLAPARLTAALSEYAAYANAIAGEIRLRLLAQDAMGSLAENLALPGLLAIAGLILGVFVRGWLVRRLDGMASSAEGIVQRVLIGISLTLARLILTTLALVILLGGAKESGLFGPVGQSLLDGLAICVAIIIGAYAFGSAYFSPPNADMRIASLDDEAAASARRWLIYLAAIVGLDALVTSAATTPPFGKDALTVSNLALLVVGGFLIWRFVRAAGIGARPLPANTSETEDTEDEDPAEDASSQPASQAVGNAIRLITSLSAVLAPLLAIFGFYAASRYAFYPVMLSCAVIGFCYLLFAVARAIVGASAGQTGNSAAASAAGEERAAPLQLIPVMVGFLLALAVLPVLALIWGADVADLQTIFGHAIEGFSVGDVQIAPFDFVLFVIVFVIGYMVTRVLQGLIRRSVLPYTRLDSGLRSAILAGIGYLGVFLSALIAISATGIDLSNLAIVAGALSVGIGFGLQNIVNNFVSGIILLIERPIKTGDWVEIGGVHGTVQKVNVRSTEIQTFDRSTMFVPNADLISGTVTNWTHGNAHGRLIVPVGVAYGSDARQVESVLLDVARAHPMLLRRPAPYVVFAGFGADSLDFEIRGVLSDVNWILSVGSDLRYEIYAKFTEAGIEIPFAQRDITIKNLGLLAPPNPPSHEPRGPATSVPPAEGPDAD